MKEERRISDQTSFFISWVLANSIGLGVGWALGELLGLQVANSFGWKYGKIVGFLICEGFIWLSRWAVLSRVRELNVLSVVDIIAWLLGEALGWIVGRGSYNPDSLVGITSASVFASYSGVMVWLIIWLIRIQRPTRRTTEKLPRKLLKSALRIGKSIFIYSFWMFGMVFAITIGEKIADEYGMIIGRASSGFFQGAIIGMLTGGAMLNLMSRKIWDSDDTI